MAEEMAEKEDRMNKAQRLDSVDWLCQPGC
jgi:hypothetical protein